MKKIIHGKPVPMPLNHKRKAAVAMLRIGNSFGRTKK